MRFVNFPFTIGFLCFKIFAFFNLEPRKMPVGGRVAGKATGVFSTGGNGHSYNGFNEEIIWISIGMSILIGILILIALCYLFHQKYKKRREIYVNK